MEIPTVKRERHGNFRHVRQVGKDSNIGCESVGRPSADDGLRIADINEPKGIIKELGDPPISPGLRIHMYRDGQGAQFDDLSRGEIDIPGVPAVEERDSSQACKDANLSKTVGRIAQLNWLGKGNVCTG